MIPRILATGASGQGGTGSSDVTWGMTVPFLPKGTIIFIAGVGREEGGEQNPEEINGCFIWVGAEQRWLTRIFDANNQETGHGLYYYVVPTGGLAAGSYTCGVNFKDNPKQAEKKRGVSVAIGNLLPQAPLSSVQSAGSDNSVQITNASTTVVNALLIVSCGWRVGFAATWSGNVTELVTSRGDNAAGVSIAYAIVETPTSPINITCNGGNTESKGMVAASFAPGKDKGGALLVDMIN